MSFPPIHCQYVRNQGLRASMSVSLISDDKLWGLISCGHREPLYLPYRTRMACRSVGVLVSLMIRALENRQVQREIDAREAQLTAMGDPTAQRRTPPPAPRSTGAEPLPRRGRPRTVDLDRREQDRDLDR